MGGALLVSEKEKEKEKEKKNLTLLSTLGCGKLGCIS